MKFILLHTWTPRRQGEQNRIYLNPMHIIAIENEEAHAVVFTVAGNRHYEVEESVQEVVDLIETAWSFIARDAEDK